MRGQAAGPVTRVTLGHGTLRGESGRHGVRRWLLLGMTWSIVGLGVGWGGSGMAQAVACPLTEGIVVDFGSEQIRSDQGESEATTGPVSFSLPAGTYDVVLVAFDDRSKGQPNEQWFLEGRADEAVVFTSSPTPDIPDDSDLVVATVNQQVAVPDLTAVSGRHAAFPDASSPNSLEVVCAAFEPVAVTTTTTSTTTSTTSTTLVQPPAISVTVEKTNDADQDGTFSDEETVVVDPATPGLSGTVTFRAVITNTSSVDVVINEITDAFGPNVIGVCEALEGTVLSPAGSTTCEFTIEDYAPQRGATQLDTVTVTVAEAADRDNVALAQDTSVVNFVKILGPTTTTVPATTTTISATTTSTVPELPFTGPSWAGLLSGVGAVLMLASAGLLGSARRMAAGVVVSSTDWLAEPGKTRVEEHPEH
jgi:hypothetical protein